MENVSVWLKDLLHDTRSGPVNIGLIQQLVRRPSASPQTIFCLRKGPQILPWLGRWQCIWQEQDRRKPSTIGYAFNKKDHTTVIPACKKLKNF
jgi:chromosomal replication initiator protein